MLHIATVHYRFPRWIPIQARELNRRLRVPYRTWASLEGIEDPGWRAHFDRTIDARGSHAEKLNLLAGEISRSAADDDLIMFLDGDAFPIADPLPLIERSLDGAQMLAVRREENAGDPQPHPCFCVMRVGVWRQLPGDWSEGLTWSGPHGTPITDVGANLLQRLESTGTSWAALSRTNRRNPHPVLFGVYGDVIYHHGAGFRLPVTRGDLARMSKAAVEDSQAVRNVGDRNRRLSEALFDRIQRDEPGWQAELV